MSGRDAQSTSHAEKPLLRPTQLDFIQRCKTLNQLGRLFHTRGRWNSAESEMFYQTACWLSRANTRSRRTKSYETMNTRLEEMRVNLPKVPEECSAFHDLEALRLRRPWNTMSEELKKRFLKRILEMESEERRLLEEDKEIADILARNHHIALLMDS